MIKYQESAYSTYVFSDTEPEETVVRGFPAWTGERMEVRPTCVIVIDIHDQQRLVITYNVTGPIEDNTVNCGHLADIGSEVISALGS